jgi:hypothetical protein
VPARDPLERCGLGIAGWRPCLPGADGVTRIWDRIRLETKVFACSKAE